MWPLQPGFPERWRSRFSEAVASHADCPCALKVFETSDGVCKETPERATQIVLLPPPSPTVPRQDRPPQNGGTSVVTSESLGSRFTLPEDRFFWWPLRPVFPSRWRRQSSRRPLHPKQTFSVHPRWRNLITTGVTWRVLDCHSSSVHRRNSAGSGWQHVPRITSHVGWRDLDRCVLLGSTCLAKA